MTQDTYIDPRGIRRKITAVNPRSDGTAITRDCGHTSDYNQTFHYTVGNDIHCYQCGVEARAKRDAAEKAGAK